MAIKQINDGKKTQYCNVLYSQMVFW